MVCLPCSFSSRGHYRSLFGSLCTGWGTQAERRGEGPQGRGREEPRWVPDDRCSGRTSGRAASGGLRRMELTLRAAVLLAGKGGGSVAILKPVGDEVWVTLQRGAWRLRGGVLEEVNKEELVREEDWSEQARHTPHQPQPWSRRGHRGSGWTSESRLACRRIPGQFLTLRGAGSPARRRTFGWVIFAEAFGPGPAACHWLSFRVTGGRNPFL